MSLNEKSSISIGAEIGAATNGDTSIDYHFFCAKTDTSLHERRAISSVVITPDEKTSSIRMKRKRKRYIAHFISPPIHMSVSYFLRARRSFTITQYKLSL